ncbi:MAG: lactate racemase domain-containing protein [Acidobacteriota bacterium]
MISRGYDDGFLSEEEIRQLMRQALSEAHLKDKRVVVIIPDGTRSAPIPLMFRLFYEYLGEETSALDFLIALGTHQTMNEDAIARLVGATAAERAEKYPRARIYNHRWDIPETFVTLGQITAHEISSMTNGLLSQPVDVRLNRMVLEYDQIIICGPTFPHEVVGFSGGNKYFFPGVGGAEVINFSHWLGALITSYNVIGTKYTPVRRVIDKAASMIDVPKLCFSMVVKGDALAGLFVGSPEGAYEAAADLSSRLHINWIAKPFNRVLSVMPRMYDDLWTASKGMYKLEPAVADGGEIVIYAPHIDEVSYTHGRLLDEIGYHVRDYFLKQWDRFKDYPGGVLAHSTHLRGLGSYDELTGVEIPRISVTLATGISAERCRLLNLGYLDPNAVNLEEWKDREAEGILLVPKAGEMLYRLKPQVVSSAAD